MLILNLVCFHKNADCSSNLKQRGNLSLTDRVNRLLFTTSICYIEIYVIHFKLSSNGILDDMESRSHRNVPMGIICKFELRVNLLNKKLY